MGNISVLLPCRRCYRTDKVRYFVRLFANSYYAVIFTAAEKSFRTLIS